MTWQALLTLYLILNTVSYILQRKLGTSLAKHKRLVAGFFFVVVHYPLGLIVAFMGHPDLAIGWMNFIILLLGSWIFPLINILYLKASKDVDAGRFTVLSNITPVATIVAATLLLGERLNATQLIGASVIIGSAVVVTLTHTRKRGRVNHRGVAVAITAFLLAGLATVYERWMLGQMDLGAYIVFGWGAQTLWMVLLAWPERKNLGVLRKKKYLLPISSFAIASAVKGVLFLAALQLSGNASLFGAFASFTAIMVVPAAYFLLKERQSMKTKVIAAIIGTIGLIILNTH
jgi:drug/metabolite transporter (DMT)-like permease